jgi:hypothetical protein
VIKLAVQQLYDTGVVKSAIRKDEFNYDLNNCAIADEYVGEVADSQDPIRDLAELAFDIVIWRISLPIFVTLQLPPGSGDK